jgi:hypothetical protein
MLKKADQQGRSELSLIRGGWDDPNCARSTWGVRDRALREQRDRPSHPTPFFSILLDESALLEVVFVNDGSGFGGKLPPFLQQPFDVFPDQV